MSAVGIAGGGCSIVCGGGGFRGKMSGRVLGGLESVGGFFLYHMKEVLEVRW